MKETMDKVLDFLQKDRNTNQKEKILYKPDKVRSLLGFVFSVAFFITMFMFCILKFSLGFVLLLGVSVGMLIFYGFNVFTKEGLYIQKYVDKRIIDKLNGVESEEVNDLNDEDYDDDDVIERKEQE